MASMDESEFANIWSENPRIRLTAARALSPQQYQKIGNYLLDGCPARGWPFGNPTVINPYVVSLGASPGGSPAKVDKGKAPPQTYDMPSAGRAHKGIYYPDSAHFWDKMRLFSQLVMPEFATDDAEALFGHLNLDTGSAGQAVNAGFDPVLAEWVMRTILYKLRPRFIVMIGLGGYLRKHPAAVGLMNAIFFGEDHRNNSRLPEPTRTFVFAGYSKRKHLFKEWDIAAPDGIRTTLVNWPQHPSRSPFSNTELWATSCREFTLKHDRN